MRTLTFASTKGTDGRVVAASGKMTRNRDFWSGKNIRLIPTGIRIDSYNQGNNPLLYNHWTDWVLGTATASHEGGMLMAEPKWHREKIVIQNGTEVDTNILAGLWDKNVLKAVSVRVGMTKDDMEQITETESEVIIPSSELYEISVTGLQADPAAVRQSLFNSGCDPKQVTSICQMLEVKMEVEETLTEDVELAQPELELDLDEIRLALGLPDLEGRLLALENENNTLRQQVEQLSGERIVTQQVNRVAPKLVLKAATPQAKVPPKQIYTPQSNGVVTQELSAPVIDPKNPKATLLSIQKNRILGGGS